MKKREIFTSQFKREAVRLMESSEKPASDVARQLGVRRNQLYKWKEQLDKRGAKAFPGAGRQKGQVDELSRLRQELAKVKEERDILKKAAGVLCQGTRVKYGFIRAHQDQFSVARMCVVLQVSRNGYYDWRDRPESKRSKENRIALSQIREVHAVAERPMGHSRLGGNLWQGALRGDDTKSQNYDEQPASRRSANGGSASRRNRVQAWWPPRIESAQATL